MKSRKIVYKIMAAATAFVCAVNGPLCAGSTGVAYAAETDAQEQSWKKNVGAGEAIAQENIIKILSVEDLEALAQQCTLDQWSAGKYVSLEADLDLTGSDFTGIPTFGGTFDGKGHTISGFSLTKSGNVNGFFRYVQEGAAVKNLTVSGEVAPDGHRDVTGGLVGNNKGLLSNCSFVGTVKGKNRTGGVAGLNEAQGQIYNCSFEGDVTGEHYAGGIVGENLGSVVRCKNSGSVNITEVKVSTEVEEFGLEALDGLTSVNNIPASTDIGGIAGASSGILQSCENTGDVGYPHVGYNIGGIVGRQSGYLDGCINSGTLNGRKDVGGIVGQFEPDVTLQYEPGMLADLYTELEVLQGLIDVTIQDAKGVSSSVSGSIQGLSDSTKNVKSATQELSDSMISWADENLEAINDFSARLSWALDQMVPAADAMSGSMDSMGDAADLLSDALEDGKHMIESGSDALGGMSDAVIGLGDMTGTVQDALKNINAALDDLAEALGSPEEMAEAIEALVKRLSELSGDLKEIEELLDKIFNRNDISDGEKELIGNLADAFGSLGRATEELSLSLSDVTVENGSLSGAEGLTDAADRVADAAKELEMAGGAVADGLVSEESGSSAEMRIAYAQAQRDMTELEKLLGEVSELFEEWETAEADGEREADLDAGREADETKDALLDKLDLTKQKAQDISERLDEMEASAAKETGSDGLAGEVKAAREQLDRIVQTAEEVEERLNSAEHDARLNADTDERPEEGTEADPEEEAESNAYFTLENVLGNGSDVHNELENADSENPEPEGRDPENPELENPEPEGQDPENSDPENPEPEDPKPDGTDIDWAEVIKMIGEGWKEVEPEIEKALGSLGGSLDSIGGNLDDLADAGYRGAAAAGTLFKASSKLKDGFRSLSSAAEVIRDTLSGLADQPAIQFTPLDAKITNQKDALDSAMDDMIAQIDGLNSVMTVSSDVMLADMEAINKQFGVIVGVLKRESEAETESIEDRIVDVSDEEEIGEQADGCVTGSVNKGEINGDVNVAGIVGAMAIEYDFDLEDDLTQNGEKSLDFSWLTSAVLSGCINSGAVEAKKNCAGGIVGRMDMGKVSDCESYGSVSSSGGSYVGGIAGVSYAVIRDSWAKCSLSGNDYVGGIAGLGETVTNCHTLVELTESGAFTGAIAGNLMEDGELVDNTFVHKKLAAVDGISYAGKAEPVAYDELLSGSETPEQFKEFELTFVADGEVVEVMRFQYGKGITSLPEIPAKEGYSAKWPDLDYSCLTFSQTVEAEYTAYESALSAGGEIPVLLVDGSFSSEAVIEDETQEMTFTDAKGKEHAGTCVTVRVNDPVLEEISYTVHYRLPDAGKRYRLWVFTGDGWEKRDYETDGNYLLLKSDGEEVTFLLEEYTILWIIVTAAAVAALVIIVILVNVGRKKKKSRKKSKKANKKREKK